MSAKRFFINNVDSFVGSALLQELTKDMAEASPDDFTVIGTYFEAHRLSKLFGVKKILKRWKPKLSRKKMIDECDVYVYDLNNCSRSDLEFGLFVLKSVPLEEPKIIIGISDVRTWANTEPKFIEKKSNEEEKGEENEDEGKSKDEENQEEQQNSKDEENIDLNENEENIDNIPKQHIENEESDVEIELINVPLTDQDFKNRIPLKSAEEIYEMEELILNLKKTNVTPIIVNSGILYGNGEVEFLEYVKSCWLQEYPEMPILGEGLNKIPTMHVKDLASYIIKVAENPPEEKPFLLAFDRSKKNTQKDILTAFSKNIGPRAVIHTEDHELFTNRFKEILGLDLFMKQSLPLSNEEDDEPADGNPEFDWFARNGIPENCGKILEEFCKVHSKFGIYLEHRPLKISMFFEDEDANELNVNEIMEKIGSLYNIPYFNISTILEDLKKEDIELAKELEEEIEEISKYLEAGIPLPLNEATKVLYRAIKWRLNSNDARNRGYIFYNYPKLHEDFEKIFKKCNLKRKKQKKKIIPKAELIDENENENEEKAFNQENENANNEIKEENENTEENEENEDGQENQENNETEENKENVEAIDDNEEEPEINEEEVVEEEEEPEEEEEEKEDDDEGPKYETFIPETYIHLKSYSNRNNLEFGKTSITSFPIINTIKKEGKEVFLFDPMQSDIFELIESLSIVIERVNSSLTKNGRPNNYLIEEEDLLTAHNEFYSNFLRNKKETKAKAIQEL